MPQLAGKGLNIIGKTVLKDTCPVQVQQPFIVGRKNTPENYQESTVVVGGNLICYDEFYYWSYPAGGQPTSSLQSPPKRAQGQSVSILETP